MTEVRERREELVQRVPRLQVLFAVSMAAICSCYWFVQVVRGDYYRELADNNRTRSLTVRSPRGLIADRSGLLLAENAPSYELTFDATRSADPERALAFAAQVLDRPLAEVRAAAVPGPDDPPFQPLLLTADLTLAQVSHFAATALEYPEFEIESGHRRLYRQGPQTAHVLGYVGEVSQEEIEAAGGRLRPGATIGKRGIERALDSPLRGRDGQRVLIVDSQGRTRAEQRREPAVPGKNLRLTLDLELQQEAARFFADKSGAAVALDPRDGAVRVMFSAPSYDPNLFSRRLDRSAWQALLEMPGDPLQNRAIQNAYAPGSVFKVVMAVAGLSEGVVGPDDSVFCAGAKTFYNRSTRCWKRGGHGWVDLYAAIQHSCDIYFYTLGQQLGVERIAEYARRFGLGSVTGLDIPGEKSGLVPDQAWSLASRSTPWYPGETISLAIGQGPLLVTPLQVAEMMAVVANRGSRVTPHVLPSEPGPLLPTHLDRRALELVRRALWAVVNDGGTAAGSRLEGLEFAGKTGTAQVVAQKGWTRSEELAEGSRDHAWFASYGPVGVPELVVVVFVEHGGHGSQAAAPLAKRLYEIHLARSESG
jgi:penicillin-binding protein 2